MDDVITLVRQVYTIDEIGQRIATEAERTVFCSVGGISRSEWNVAVGHGFDPSFSVTTAACNYEGEKIAVFHCERYKIYRVYAPGNDYVELYLQKAVGVTNGG